MSPYHKNRKAGIFGFFVFQVIPRAQDKTYHRWALNKYLLNASTN